MPEGPARIAAFVTPHGFGHAARVAAVLEALAARRPGLEIDLWTTVPEWFFAESLRRPFRRVAEAFDVGFVQVSPVAEDLPATVGALDALEAGAGAAIARAAADLAARRVALVLADQCPLALAAARRAGIPSILLESFTWDWIYAPLAQRVPRLGDHARLVRERLELAGGWIQLEPVAVPRPGAPRVPPVARRPQSDRAAVRRRLAIEDGRPMVLVSLGGVPARIAALAPLAARRDLVFVVPGGADEERSEGNLRLLPHHSPVHHPDLVAAADCVVGKLGYSTVAEAWAAGTPLAYLPRPGFRESKVLAAFVARELPSRALPAGALVRSDWLPVVDDLIATPRPSARTASGAAAVAEMLLSRLAPGR